MLKPFKDARNGDDISDLICPNPKCRQPSLRLIGKNPSQYPDRQKTLECQSCFQKYHVDRELHGFEWPGEPEKRKRKEEE